MSNSWYYGCYLGNHEKKFRWECKKFESDTQATEYATQQRDQSGLGPTLLIDVPKYCPEFLHSYQLNRLIKQITEVKMDP